MVTLFADGDALIALEWGQAPRADGAPAAVLLAARDQLFGGGDFVTNNRITKASNFTLLLNTVNWALDSGTRLDIPPRPIEQLELTMSQRQLWVARVSILFGPALGVALLGFVVYLVRRR